MAKLCLDYHTLIFVSTAVLLLAALPAVSSGENPSTPTPTVQECRGHIENALKEFIVHQEPENITPLDAASEDAASRESESQSHSSEEEPRATESIVETHEETSNSKESGEDKIKSDKEQDSSLESGESGENTESGEGGEKKDATSEEGDTVENKENSSEGQGTGETKDDTSEEKDTAEAKDDSSEEKDTTVTKDDEKESSEESKSVEHVSPAVEKSDEDDSKSKESDEDGTKEETQSKENSEEHKEGESKEGGKDGMSSEESSEEDKVKGKESSEESSEEDKVKGKESSEESLEEDKAGVKDKESSEESSEEDKTGVKDKESSEESSEEDKTAVKDEESDESKEKSKTESGESGESKEEKDKTESGESDESDETKEHEKTVDIESEESKESEEEEVKIEREPIELRSRTHVDHILGLDDESMESTIASEKPVQITLRELKKMYESAVKPMEVLYKFKDISNRFVGDAEIFSKPIILFIGPWSSGKSSIINYLLDTEDTLAALKTGAEPQSNGFTVLMYGETEQTMDGMEIAADWTFSSLQKFGQSFLDRLQGLRLPNNLLRKVTIIDTPGIMENRKQLDRAYPFNDACQWFIDRADIIYVVFDPTKLDMGLEMEALFDQLKGRESQARIMLNKADLVSPQELMKVQSTLLWNLSPLLGSSEPPTVYVGSFRSHEFLPGSPSTLFYAQEYAFLQDLRQTIDGRVENKISFTRRHAVRVRNHAKMVDCYLNTYYNHKTFFSNKKKIAEEIIDNPQNYHIYEGLSTLTNISRYDLPDPDIYRDFFKVNPLYDFKLLASTCSYFKGCPLDKLDLAIAYELPELMGKYRKSVGFGSEGKR